jgi:hypothetical protein
VYLDHHVAIAAWQRLLRLEQKLEIVDRGGFP